MRVPIVLAAGLVVLAVVGFILAGCSAASAARDSAPPPEPPVAVAQASLNPPLPRVTPGDQSAIGPESQPQAEPEPEHTEDAAQDDVAAGSDTPEVATTSNFPEDPDGSLDAGDLALGDGTYCDLLFLPIEAEEGGDSVRLRVAVVASDFVPSVGVVTSSFPNGQFALAEEHPIAMLDLVCEAPDEITIVVSPGVPGQTGRYYLCVAVGDDEVPGWEWFSGPGAELALEAPSEGAALPDWEYPECPEDYGAAWDEGVGPEQIMLFGVRPFSRDCFYMSLTGRIRYLHHVRTDAWLPRGAIDAALWLPHLGSAIRDSILKRTPPAPLYEPEEEADEPETGSETTA